jgi:hypothetical protein
MMLLVIQGYDFYQVGYFAMILSSPIIAWLAYEHEYFPIDLLCKQDNQLLKPELILQQIMSFLYLLRTRSINYEVITCFRKE